MPRTKARPATAAEPIIHPHGMYRWWHLTAILGTPAHTLRTAVRAGELRRSRRGKQYFYPGAWVLEWIYAGEQKPARKDAP